MILLTQKLNKGQSQSLRVSGLRSMVRVKMLSQVVCAIRFTFQTGELAVEAEIEEAIEAAVEDAEIAEGEVVEAVVVAVDRHLKKNTQSEVEKVTFQELNPDIENLNLKR